MLGEDDVPIHAVIAPSLFRTSFPSYQDQGKLR
jgi:hypothetical protein